MWLLSNPWHEKQEECNNVFQNASKNNSKSLYEKNNKPQMYDNRIKIETKSEKKQLVTTTRIISNYVTVPLAMFDKNENRFEIKADEIKLVLKKCFETPLEQNNQGSMLVSIIVLILYLCKYKYFYKPYS